MPPSRRRVRRPSSSELSRTVLFESSSFQEYRSSPSSRSASYFVGETCSCPATNIQHPAGNSQLPVQPRGVALALPPTTQDAARPGANPSHALDRSLRAARIINANSALSTTLERASRGTSLPEPSAADPRTDLTDVAELSLQAVAEDEPIVPGEVIFPDELIPGHIEFKADDSHKFWKWDVHHQNWYHRYEDTGDIVWAPRFLC